MSMINLEKKVYFGGSIVTMNENQPFVEAVGIEGEKIVSVGDLEDVKKVLGDESALVDLKGHSLLPGFIDCHLHPIIYIFYLLSPDVSDVKSIEELKEYLGKVAKEKNKDELMMVFNLCEEKFDVPKLPNKRDLDEACPDHPVFVLRYDGHIGIANTKALELAKIDEHSIVPEGGEIRKDSNGNLTGVISEKALDIILAKMSFPNVEKIKVAAVKAFRNFAQEGLTSLHGILSADSTGEFGDAGAMELPLRKSIQNSILQNWYALINTEKPKKLLKLRKPPLDGGKKDSKFKVGALKLFLDGTFGAKTACMFEPFSDEPGACGFCVVEEGAIYAKMVVAHNNGFQIGIHAIGDKGNRIVMDLYKKLLKEFPRDNHRHRIEHASMLTKDVIKDMATYGVIASCQPPFINSEYTWLVKRLGEERCKYTYPMKSIVDAGVVLASGSDCPIEDPSPILGLHALVTRNGFIPEESLSMEEALKTYTINAAYAAFEENVKGSIEVGKLADFVVLDKNPLEVPKDEIKEIRVLETIIRGRSVFKKE